MPGRTSQIISVIESDIDLVCLYGSLWRGLTTDLHRETAELLIVSVIPNNRMTGQ